MSLLKKSYLVIPLLCLALSPWASHGDLAHKAVPLEPSFLRELDQLGIFGKHRVLLEIEKQKGTFEELLFTSITETFSKEDFIHIKVMLGTMLGVVYIWTLGYAELHGSYFSRAVIGMLVYLLLAAVSIYLVYDSYTNPAIFAWTNTGLLIVENGELHAYKKEGIQCAALIYRSNMFSVEQQSLRLFLTQRGKYVDLLLSRLFDEDSAKEICKKLSINLTQGRSAPTQAASASAAVPAQVTPPTSDAFLSREEEKAYFDKEIQDIIEKMRAQGRFDKIKLAYHLRAPFWHTCLVYFVCLAQGFFIIFKLCKPTQNSRKIYHFLRFMVASIQSLVVAEWAIHYLGKRLKKGWALLTDDGLLTITGGYQHNAFFSPYDRVKVKVYGTAKLVWWLFISDKKGPHCSHPMSAFSSPLAFQAFHCALVRAIEG